MVTRCRGFSPDDESVPIRRLHDSEPLQRLESNQLIRRLHAGEYCGTILAGLQ